MQLALPVKLDDSATFDNFYLSEGSRNANALSSLVDNDHKSLYIWGTKDAGVTHLLQACCRQAENQARSAIYLPLAEFRGEPPEALLSGLENLDVVCLDDIHALCSSSEWSNELFHLYNRILDTSTKLVVGANVSAKQIAMPLPDLQSRLTAMLAHKIEKLDDEGIASALIYRANKRGLEMVRPVADYLLNHYGRRMHDLFELLENLDSASLATKRKLTIPFVKTLLET